MRTFDKLIATIWTGQAQEDLRLCSGTPVAGDVRVPVNVAALQEAG